ncbi:hypothetical protein C8R46DRAFT_1228915 [Mycena filopes]|nr:hypothetical protein C8R46DRAFT_1228915 [Mycena filopes]
MSLTFTSRYHFIYALSLLQAGIGMATFWAADVSEQLTLAISVHLVLVISGLLGALVMHRRLVTSLLSTESDSLSSRIRFSRVDTQYTDLVILSFLGFASVFIITSNYELYLPGVGFCTSASQAITQPACIPLAMDILLPSTIAVTTFFAARVLRRRAITLYGTDLVAVPHMMSFATALYGVSGSTAKAPTWLVAQVAHVLREGDEIDSQLSLPR